jgi:hypothetical protein
MRKVRKEKHQTFYFTLLAYFWDNTSSHHVQFISSGMSRDRAVTMNFSPSSSALSPFFSDFNFCYRIFPFAGVFQVRNGRKQLIDSVC